MNTFWIAVVIMLAAAALAYTPILLIVRKVTLARKESYDEFMKKRFFEKHGIVIEVVITMDAGVPSEVEYTDEHGERVGYWAYGHWDPQCRMNYRNFRHFTLQRESMLRKKCNGGKW